MKVDGNGQGKILNQDELRRLFTEGFLTPRDRALFGICLFTGCRVSEALALQTTDIKSGAITFRKSTTKGKHKTRIVDIPPTLAAIMDEYQPKSSVMFPGMRGVTERLTRFMADKILRDACKRIGVEGVSTHSFRRTALTQMSSAGIPLRTIQEISGHSDLGTLQRYLEVTPEQKRKAVSVIGF
ncbi:site-specific integrase [Komarekiella sp. 'clone 1']|uniref:Site-specific integrase n=1 Tax=Komarekiella delphini-convector SJRDD-AB1 TaxID=2593771 RepID=A0AA40T4A8_9NOST|nr:site-specific integrase [Komarekiella delphini-convector]MBD6620410.1 site-specific integrase [Komarekiella delphini-convector SJRDD-AB1]